MRDVKKYKVFQLSDRLVLDIYKATARCPKSEAFGLTGQMRRGLDSDEPRRRLRALECKGIRPVHQHCRRFIEELRYQLHLSLNLGYLSEDVQSRQDSDYEQVKKMLSRPLAAVSC